MSAAHSEYVLGRSQREYTRLARQAELFKPMTRRFFEDAGIAPRMRVLDLGSGPRPGAPTRSGAGRRSSSPMRRWAGILRSTSA